MLQLCGLLHIHMRTQIEVLTKYVTCFWDVDKMLQYFIVAVIKSNAIIKHNVAKCGTKLYNNYTQYSYIPQQEVAKLPTWQT